MNCVLLVEPAAGEMSPFFRFQQLFVLSAVRQRESRHFHYSIAPFHLAMFCVHSSGGGET